MPFGVLLLEHVLTADFSSCLRLRNGVKYCKVLRLPEVSKSALILTIHSADSEEVKRVEVELTQQFVSVAKLCIDQKRFLMSQQDS